jgi:hypothetical protein
MKTMEEIIEANAKARAGQVDREYAACVDALLYGDARTIAMWDGTAERFRELGLHVQRVKGSETFPDGTAGRWWIYPQPAGTEVQP